MLNNRNLPLLCATIQNLCVSRYRSTLLKCVHTTTSMHTRKKSDAKLNSLFKPVPVQHRTDDINVGAELTGKIDKSELLKILNKFTQKREIKGLCMENGIDSK